MKASCIGALLLLSSLPACSNDDGDDGSDLFGDGGTTPSMPGPTDGGEADDTAGETGAEDDGPPTPPPPPPPPLPTSGDDGDTGQPPPDSDEDTGDDPTTGTTGDGSDGTDTFNDGTVEVEVITDSMHAAGQCDHVTVTNVSGMPVTWEIELPLPGTIDQVWNAEVVEAGGMGTFTGADFNATLDPGAMAMFGYCVVF